MQVAAHSRTTRECFWRSCFTDMLPASSPAEIWSAYDSVAFHFIATNAHPDHDTIAVFR